MVGPEAQPVHPDLETILAVMIYQNKCVFIYLCRSYSFPLSFCIRALSFPSLRSLYRTLIILPFYDPTWGDHGHHEVNHIAVVGYLCCVCRFLRIFHGTLSSGSKVAELN